LNSRCSTDCQEVGHSTKHRAKEFRSAGVSPAFLLCVEIRKIAGETPALPLLLVVFHRFAAERRFRRSWRAGASIILKLRVSDGVVSLRGMVRVRCQLAPELARANIWRILDAQTALIKGFGGNRQCEFARFARSFPHGESILADLRFHFVTKKLHDDFVTHLAPTTVLGSGTAAIIFFALFVRLRLGGVPSAASTTIMLVTNFFMP
jgi:hypothetical protein